MRKISLEKFLDINVMGWTVQHACVRSDNLGRGELTTRVGVVDGVVLYEDQLSIAYYHQVAVDRKCFTRNIFDVESTTIKKRTSGRLFGKKVLRVRLEDFGFAGWLEFTPPAQ